MDNQNVSIQIEAKCEEVARKVLQGVRLRGMRASNELRNASQLVLRGQRSGRRYNVPGTGSMRYYKRGSRDGKHKAHTATISYRTYTASAPGEPPAMRTGTFRASWQPKQEVTGGADSVSVRSYIESNAKTPKGHHLGTILENGTSRMAPRPYKEKVQQKALPKIKKIFKEPYM